MNENLINAVAEQMGYGPTDEEFISYMHDVANHGADSGFSGFAYYTDTVEFFKQNREAIVQLCKDYASDFGTDVISMIAGFNCLDDDPETRDEIERAIYGRLERDDLQVPNALAWFALEEVARHLTDN